MNLENRSSAAWLSPRFALALVLLFGALVTLAGLNVRELESGDETRVAGIGAAMFLSGDYVIPHLNGTPFLEYPPMFYWFQAVSCRFFGMTDLAMKLPSALAALGAGVVLFFFGLRLKFSPGAALTGAVMLFSGAQFFVYSRKCMVDMLLAFFILLAVYAFYAMRDSRRFRNRAGFFLLFAAGLCGGVFTKGLIGLAMPLAALGGWLVSDDLLRRKIRWSGYLALGFGSLLALGGVAVWCRALYLQGGGDLLHTVVITNNFGRFSGDQGDHVEPFWYYLLKLPGLFWPWLPLLPFALWCALRDVRNQRGGRLLPVLTFLLVPLLMLVVSASKRQVYLLPLYAPCALLCAWYLFEILLPQFRPEWSAVFRRFRVPLLILILIVLGGLAGFSSGAAMVYPAAAALALVFWSRDRSRARRLVWLTVAGGLFFASIDTSVLAAGNGENSLRPLFEECARLEAAGGKIVLLDAAERTSGAACFYLGHPLPELDPEKVTIPPFQPGEYRILRDKRRLSGGREFADHHWLLDR